MSGAPGPPLVLDVGAKPPLRTERLLLRPLRADDAAALHAYRSLEQVARYVPFASMTMAEIDERLAGPWSRTRIGGEDGDGVLFGVERGDTEALIGDVSLWLASAADRSAEIGWVLHPGHGGHGYATEAVRAVLGIAFTELTVHRVVARIDARNTASLRLCDRLGMRREAILRENEWFKGAWTDEVDYALLESEWPPSSSPMRSATESTIRDAR